MSRRWPNDPQDAPDFWTHEIRRVTDVDGVLLVVFRDQDGEVFVMEAEEYDHPGSTRL